MNTDLKKVQLVAHARQTFEQIKPSGWALTKASIGSGNQASVCVVQHDNGVEGVFRCLRPDADKTSVARFEREIEVLQALQHPNILRMLDHGSSEHGPWYISQRGTPLKSYWTDFCANHAPQDIERHALELVRAIASGLAQCHANKLVHRDIKTNNVVVLTQGNQVAPVLIDFGVVWVSGAEPLTLDGSAVGNARYSPDFLRRRPDECPPWVDVFELMQVFQWMVCERDSKHSWQRPTHWRYLSYPPDSSPAFIAAVGALGAASSSDLSCPKDANQLLELMDTIFGKPSLGESDALNDSQALPKQVQEAVALGLAQRITGQTADEEAIDAALEVASLLLDPLCEELAKLAKPPHVTVKRHRKLKELFQANLLQDVLLLDMEAEVAKAGAFGLQLHVHAMVPSRWPHGGKPAILDDYNAIVFSIHRPAIRASRDYPYEEAYFALGRNGRLLECEKGYGRQLRELDQQGIVSRASAMLYDDKAWESIAAA